MVYSYESTQARLPRILAQARLARILAIKAINVINVINVVTLRLILRLMSQIK